MEIRPSTATCRAAAGHASGFGCGLLLVAALLAGCTTVDNASVVVTSTAAADYTAAKFRDGVPVRQTYVFMEGNYFAGHTVDRSLDGRTFRSIAAAVAPDLARQSYFPATGVDAADLLLVLHWGVTSPKVSLDELRAVTSRDLDLTKEKEIEALVGANGDMVSQLASAMHSRAEAEQWRDGQEHYAEAAAFDFATSNNAQLLGYARHLRKMAERTYSTPDEVALRHDLTTERYFIILRAYDLKNRMPDGRMRVVWTVYTNMRSPGTNFDQAVDLMASVVVEVVGRQTDEVLTLSPKLRQGKVEVGDLVIINED